MPVAFKTSGSDTNPTGTQSAVLAVLKPATVADGDFLVASVGIAGGGAVTITPPVGWTLIRRTDNGSTFGFATYYRQAMSEPPAWGWAFSISDYHSVIVRAYSGVDIFYPVDAEDAVTNVSGTSQATPSVVTASSNTVLVATFVANGNVTISPPTGYTERVEKAQNTATIEGCDTTLGASGATAIATGTFSGAQLGIAHVLCLKPSIIASNVEQVRTALKSLFPPGSDQLYDWDNSTDPAELWKLTQALATFLQQYGFAYADLMRQEVNPLTWIAKLSDWEGVLGITQNTASSVNKWIATRQTAIISKLRESGATTLAALRAVLEPLLGYSAANAGTLQIIECDRAQLTAAHTYSNATGAVIGSGSSTTQTVGVSDDGSVSAAGVQVQITLTSTNPDQLSFVLTGPTSNGGGTGSGQATVTWAAGSLPAGSIASTTVYLYSNSASGKYVTGTWSLQINTGAAGCTVVNWGLFTEGGGSRDAFGGSGLGTDAFTWSAYADPAKVVNPDYAAAIKAITRMQPGYSQGYLVTNASALPTTVLYPPFIPRLS